MYWTMRTISITTVYPARTFYKMQERRVKHGISKNIAISSIYNILGGKAGQ